MLVVERSAYRSYRGVCLPALGPLLLQEYITATGQRPETQNTRSGHDLIMIAAEELLEIIEESLDLPADRQDAQDRLSVGLQKAGHEVTGLLYAGIRSRTHNQNLAST